MAQRLKNSENMRTFLFLKIEPSLAAQNSQQKKARIYKVQTVFGFLKPKLPNIYLKDPLDYWDLGAQSAQNSNPSNFAVFGRFCHHWDLYNYLKYCLKRCAHVFSSKYLIFFDFLKITKGGPYDIFPKIAQKQQKMHTA